MNLKDLASRAKDLVDKRGGTGALREDADELKRIAQGEGSVKDKAKAAAEALKDPGAEQAAPDAPARTPREPTAPGAEAAATEPRTKRGRGGQGKRRGGRGGGRGRDRL